VTESDLKVSPPPGDLQTVDESEAQSVASHDVPPNRLFGQGFLVPKFTPDKLRDVDPVVGMFRLVALKLFSLDKITKTAS
jgi:hypothetical protein